MWCGVVVCGIQQFAFKFARPEIKGGSEEDVLPCRFGLIFQLDKRPNAETALQNAFKDHLLDLGPGKLKTHVTLVSTVYIE